MKVYTLKEYSLAKLLSYKARLNQSVGLALPVLNEEKTLQKTLKIISKYRRLIDQFVVIDSGSVDNSVKVCKEMGFRVVLDKTAACHLNKTLCRGKGWNMWASLFYLKTDLIVWVDSDIKNFNARFVLGLLGPLLENPSLQFIKGFYERPKGDARITEIMARPFINLFFPEISEVVQPLSGEYGGRKKFLESIEFYSGYSVEMALLIQAYHRLKAHERAQVYLGKRIHVLQDVPSLGRMSASILRTMVTFAEKYSVIKVKKPLNSQLRQFNTHHGAVRTRDYEVVDQKLPPMLSIQTYGRRKV